MSQKMKIILLSLTIVAAVLGIVCICIKPNQNNSNKPASETSPAEQTPSPSEDVPDNTAAVPTTAPKDDTKPLNGLTICIDPGHQIEQMKDTEDLAPWDKTKKQKVSSGTCGTFSNVNEYVVNLDISLKIRDTLTSLGANVVMVRETNDVKLSNQDRAKIGNDCNADVVLRIHCNGSDNPNVNGIELWVRGDGDGTDENKNKSKYDFDLASELLNYLVNETGASKRNVNKSNNYTGLNWSTVPSIIIECGFMSNETEDLNLVTDAYQQKFADGIAKWLTSSEVLKR